MKTSYLFLWLLISSTSVHSQTGFTNYSLTAGLSTVSSKMLSFSIFKSSNKLIQTGMSCDAILFTTRNDKLSLAANKTILAIGPLLKAQLGARRNFSHSIFLGGSLGSDNSHTIWYPSLGLEQNFFSSPHGQIVFSEKCLYLFGAAQNNWQPFFTIGYRFSL